MPEKFKSRDEHEICTYAEPDNAYVYSEKPEPDIIKILLSVNLEDSFSIDPQKPAKMCTGYHCNHMHRVKIRAMPKKFTGFIMSGYSSLNTVANSILNHDQWMQLLTDRIHNPERLTDL